MNTDFLLGGGLAFLLALLGWSDQIRGVQEKARAWEREFVEAYSIRWGDLRALVRPSEQAPKDRLLAVLRLLEQGAVADAVDVGLLRLFERVDATRTRLEVAYSYRYWAIVLLCCLMLTFGMLSLGLSGPVSSECRLTWTGVYSAVTAALLALIVGFTTYTAIQESSLRRQFNEIEDSLRTARDRRGDKGH